MNIQSPMIQLPPPNIPSEDGYVMFIGVVNMMAHKCMINGGTVALNTCLSRPDFLARPL